MHTKFRIAVLAATLALLIAPAAHSEDTDLFLTSKLPNVDNPNVLIIIDDSSANNSSISATTCPDGVTTVSTKLDMEVCSIQYLLKSIAASTNPNLNIGLELFTNNPSPNKHGAFIAAAIQPLATGLTKLTTAVGGVFTTCKAPLTCYSASNSPYALSLEEAYDVFRGGMPYGGAIAQADPNAFVGQNYQTGNYVTPINGNCQKNYIIFIGNGKPDSGENTAAYNQLTADLATYNEPPPVDIPITPTTSNAYQSSWVDEYALFLNQNAVKIPGAQKIATYVIFVPKSGDPQVPSEQALLNNTAVEGGTQQDYEATNETSFITDITNVFTEIQAVNSVFASVTLPVSVNQRGTNLNQVYMGVFRPDPDAYPLWRGNLKEYQLIAGSTPGSLELADINGNPATDPNTGFIVSTAVSWWTTANSTPLNYWSFNSNETGGPSDSPDGSVVEKGAEAEWLRDAFASSSSTTPWQPARQLYTCTGSCATTQNSLLSGTLFDTNNTNITQANTGTTSATDLNNLINWVRGEDVTTASTAGTNGLGNEKCINGVNGTGTCTPNYTEIRPSIHGDVLHSRPAVVNYNRNGDNNDVFVFYGGNDGIFHAIQGGQIQPVPPLLPLTSTQGGTEKWGFIPPEFFGSLKPLRDNNVKMDLTLSDNPRTPDKPYFADGPIDVYQNDADADGILDYTKGDQVYLYIGMRRGGRLLYALDVSNPAAPNFLWKHASTDTGLAELGQTWSLTRPAAPVKMAAFNHPVVIMGGGYDPTAEDSSDSSGNGIQGTAKQGRAIMIIDATNGALLWEAAQSPSSAFGKTTPVPGMAFDIPGDVVALVRNNNQGLVDRLYAADTGGNIWRVDCANSDPGQWKVTLLAALRETSSDPLGTSSSDARKFLFAPDVVFGDGVTQNYDAILIGSGDREHPFDTTVANRFYMIKDPGLGTSEPSGFQTITESNSGACPATAPALPTCTLYDATADLIQVGTATQQTTAQAALNSQAGWYIRLASGEKVVGDPVTVNGAVFFGTNTPTNVNAPGTCTNLGIAQLYALNFQNGAATIDQNGDGLLTTSDRATTVPGGGFPPSPVPVSVTINGKPYSSVLSGTQVQTPPNLTLGRRYTTYWQNEHDN